MARKISFDNLFLAYMLTKVCVFSPSILALILGMNLGSPDDVSGEFLFLIGIIALGLIAMHIATISSPPIVLIGFVLMFASTGIGFVLAIIGIA